MGIIETTALRKDFGDVTAVDGIDLTIEAGSLHGFVGHNGAGKTTTMQMLVGLVTPTDGSATIGGDPAGSLAARRRIGYAPQYPEFYDSMSGRRYLEYVGKLTDGGVSPADRAQELLSFLELEEAADRPIGGYSGGMQRKLNLAQAMMHEPEVLLLDEPTAALDPEGRAAIIETLEDLATEGVTVFVSSHVLAELEQFIDHVTFLNEGSIVASGPLEQVIEDTGGRRYRVDSTDNERLRERIASLESVGAVEAQDDGPLLVTPVDEDAFTAELPHLVSELGINLQTMEQADSLEERFLDIREGDQ